MAYGRHQSFYIKNNWINKGIKAIVNDSSVFNNVENYKNLGIGKNMFMALKYWLYALNIANKDFSLTTFGKYLLKCDLSCNSSFSLNLLHYYLSLKDPINESPISDTFFFVFNIHDYKSFNKDELLESLMNWDMSNNIRPTSDKTISRDIDCLIQTYTKIDKQHPEDLNFSVLAKLNLFKKNKDFLTRIPLKHELISKEAMFYVMLRMVKDKPTKNISVDELENSEMSLGRVFHLTRADIIDLIEEMISEGFPLVITRTNNLDTVVIDTDQNSEDYIEQQFNREVK